MEMIPVEYFVCPISKAPLQKDGMELISPTGEKYSFVDGQYWSFMPKKMMSGAKWQTWETLQKNGERSYQCDPEHNLGITDRADFIEFGRFCDFHGLVLDIGCGPQRCPTHFRHCTRPEVTFLGIDPLVGEQPKDYLFVQGLGEFLPFHADLFDQVLFVTSLDHFPNPVDGLREAKRIIKADGEICIWIAEKDKNAPRPATSPDWYLSLKTPKEAEDPFHFKRFDHHEFMMFVEEVGLKIKEQNVITVDEYRRNIFCKLVK